MSSIVDGTVSTIPGGSKEGCRLLGVRRLWPANDRQAMARPFSLALVLAALLPIAASAQERCTRETLVVQGAPVTIGYCVSGLPRMGGNEEIVVPVRASYAAASGAFGEAGELRFVAGEKISRVLEDLDLTRLGLTGTLHLTLSYSGGLVRIEGALLTPGAITVK